MAKGNEQVGALRAAWEKAVEKDRPKDAQAALEKLEKAEPGEARWPHRHGDVLRRLGRPKDAEAAYGRAMTLYEKQGFLARAAALAKTIADINPARADLVGKVDQDAARALRRQSRPAAAHPSVQFKAPAPPRLPSGTMAAIAMPPDPSAPLPREIRIPSTQNLQAMPGGAIRPPSSAQMPAVRAEDPFPARAPMAPRTPLAGPGAPAPAAARGAGAPPPAPLSRDPAPLPELPSFATPPAAPPPDLVRASRGRAFPPPIPRDDDGPELEVGESVAPDEDYAFAHDDDEKRPERPSMIAGMAVDRLSVVVAAPELAPAADAGSDEVRFTNLGDDHIDVDLTDYELESMIPPPDLEVEPFGRGPSAMQLAAMAGGGLLADVSKEAAAQMLQVAQLQEMEVGALLFTPGRPATAFYLVIEGAVRLEVPGGARGSLDIGEGQVFGEECLLEEATYRASARARTATTLFRISKDALDALTSAHPSVGDVLFNVLVKRLVGNALGTSPLFTGFDPGAQADVAKLFEVRRVSPGTVLAERGRRIDGLYILVAGEFEVDDGRGLRKTSLGSLFGQGALLSNAPSGHSVRACRDGVVLRLAAGRFGSFLAQHPMVLATLADLQNVADVL